MRPWGRKSREHARRSGPERGHGGRFNDAGVKAVKGLVNNAVVATIATSQRWNQRFYFYFMCSGEPNLCKEVDKAAESTHAEMGGGKELFKDFNYVVVIAGIGLVEVEKPLVIVRVGRYDHRLN